MQNKFGLSVEKTTKNNIKYSLAFVLLVIPATSYADFSFTNYPYTLTNLHNLLVTNHQINTFSNYTINFTSVQTSGTVTTYQHQNPDLWIPISYIYNVAPNPGVVESTNIAITSNNQNITGYFHNMSSSQIISDGYYSINNIAGDFIGNNQIDEAGAITARGNMINIMNIYGDFIDNSSSMDGGAIEYAIYNSSLYHLQGNFINNISNKSGGAIYNSGTIEHISGNFIHNSANNMGGAISNNGSISYDLIGNFIDNRSNNWGGAIYNTGIITTKDSSFINNNSSAGGAVFNIGNLSISDSEFIQNSGDEGGAIWNSYIGTLNAINNNLLFSYNKATENGGAIYNASTGQTTFNANNQSVVFSHNQAEANGGAIYNVGTMILNANDGYVTFEDNKIGNNTGNGGAIYNAGTMSLNINDGYVYFNNSGAGGAIYNTGTLTLMADNGIGDIKFTNNSDYAITTSGTINFGTNTHSYFFTESDKIILLDNAIINISGSVHSQDINGSGTINNTGWLNIQGHIGTDVHINNTGMLILSATDVNNNISISENGHLSLTDGTLNYTPHYDGILHIYGDVISNVPIEQQEIYLYADTSLHISADNIIADTSINGDIHLTGGNLNNYLSGVGKIITTADTSGKADNFGKSILNDYNLTLSSGTLSVGITGNGNIITAGNIYSSADNLGNNIINNDYTLTLSDGIVTKNITGNGNIIIDGNITINNTANVAQNITINNNKKLSVYASNINSNIIDNGTLVLTGGTLTTENISGNGDILITGNVTSEVGVNQALQIAQNASLNINADNILHTIVNNGTLALSGGTLTQQISGNINIIGNVHTSASNLLSDNVTNDSHNLTLTGGTLAHSITGAGNTIIDGEVVISDPAYNNIVAITNNININSGAELYAHANALQNNVQNSGNLHLTGGMLDFNVTGGNTIIDGNIDNKALLNTSIIINNTKTLSTTADNIAGQVNNNGTLALNGGILNQQIIGNGTININAEVHSSADKFQGSGFINNASNLFFTDGTLEQVVSGNGNIVIGGLVQSYAANLLNNVIVSDENALTLTGGTLSRVINTTGQGKVVIDGHVSTAASNLLTDVSVNAEKILTLSGGTLDTKITGTGLVEIDGIVEIANNKTVDTNIAINTDKYLTASINSIGGAVINNGLLTLTDGGTLSSVISGSGNIVAKANVDKITTSADYLQNPLQLQSSATKVVLTDGTLNNKINGGSIVVAGNVNSHANNIGADVSNNGTFVLTGGTLTHHINGAGDFEIGSGTLTTNADMLHMSKITNNGVLDVTSGILTQDVVGGKTIIADGAGISSKNIGNLELNGNMYVGNNTITATNTIINGTVNMDIEKISANSNEYIGGHLIADNVSLGDNSKLNLTIYNTDLLKGESTGDISLISTNGDWSGSFGSIFQNNNRYSISFDDTTKTFAITHVKIGADVIAEAGGTNDDIAVASAWDDLPSSTLPNVQRIIDEINHRSQHDTDGYLQLIKSLQPVKTNVVHGVSRSLNNAINTQITERLTAVTPNGRNGGDTQAKTGIWAQGMYNKSNQSGDYSFNGNTIGVIAGFDTTFGANITMGAGYAFSTTDIEADMRNLEVDGHNLFIYGRYQGENWHVNANLSYGMSDYTDNATALDLNNSRYARRVFPTQNTKNGGTSLSDSEYSTNTIGASALFGYNLNENLDVNVGTRFNHITVDDYIDMAGQSVSIDDMNFMTVLGGFSYGKQGQNWTPVIHIAATYDVLSDDYIANVDLGGSGYVINGENIDPFGIEAGISLETNGDIWDFSIGYDIEWHSNFISHTGKAKLKYNF